MKFKLKGKNLYRFLAVLGFIIVVVLVTTIPDRFKEPDDWAYYYATENMRHGRLTVDTALHQQQVAEARSQGGQLIQYIRIDTDRWAFEKAPGYVYFLIPFYLAGIPQLANILLAAGLALVIYLLLKELKDEKAALFGVLLGFFTPVSLAMMQREYMDGFASAAFIGIGGGIYIYYHLRSQSLKTRTATLLLFLSGLFIAGSVAVRYTNATIAAVFLLHFLITCIRLIRRGKWSEVWKETLPLGVGAVIPTALLLWYHQTVFGSPFTYGYEYSQLNVKFAYDYLGDPRAWQIITTNIGKMLWPLFAGFPLLVLAVPAMVVNLWQKFTTAFMRLKHLNKKDWFPKLTPDVFILLVGLFIAVFGLYIMYEWTANQRAIDQPLIVLTRFYLPALLPLVVFAAHLLARIPGKIILALVAVAIISGGALFIQLSMRERTGQPSPPVRPQPLGQVLPSNYPNSMNISNFLAPVDSQPGNALTIQ